MVNPPLSVYVGIGLNMTTTSCALVAEFDGITNVAVTVFVVGREIFAPLMLPANVTVGVGALAGGFIGVVGKVMVIITVCPRDALPPGATALVPNTVTPGLSKLATLVRPVR